MKKHYELLSSKLELNGIPYKCNDNIPISEEDVDRLLPEVEENVKELMKSLLIDLDNCHNSNDTPRRIAKMLLRETMAGRYEGKPAITSFPNAMKLDEMYIVGPIEVKSLCAHHWQNIKGWCWIGVYPGKEVIGLSKFNRVVDWISRRPQIQEEMTIQIADEIEKITKAEGIAVVMKAEHACVTMRGVNAPCSNMTTSVMRGKFRHDPNLKSEFLTLIED